MSSHLLILPRLRVQNANCISSSMTWGFPSITAFTGWMVALERRLGTDFGLHFESVGVICHSFEAQVTRSGYTRSFHLTRNPVLRDGGTGGIVEEGRAHLEVTLVLGVQSEASFLSEEDCQEKANAVAAQVAGMRIAGGSVMPPVKSLRHSMVQPRLLGISMDEQHRERQFKQLRRYWLPGFALVSRDDVLQQHWQTMSETNAAVDARPTLLDAWLDLSRINHRATQDQDGKVVWQTDKRTGWLVPIPVGFAALSSLQPAGTVANARDMQTPFRWVESIYSIGQWVSPHRLVDASALMWRPVYDASLGLYRCVNHYSPLAQDEMELEPQADLEQDTSFFQPDFD